MKMMQKFLYYLTKFFEVYITFQALNMDLSLTLNRWDLDFDDKEYEYTPLVLNISFSRHEDDYYLFNVWSLWANYKPVWLKCEKGWNFSLTIFNKDIFEAHINL